MSRRNLEKWFDSAGAKCKYLEKFLQLNVQFPEPENRIWQTDFLALDFEVEEKQVKFRVGVNCETAKDVAMQS